MPGTPKKICVCVCDTAMLLYPSPPITLSDGVAVISPPSGKSLATFAARCQVIKSVDSVEFVGQLRLIPVMLQTGPSLITTPFSITPTTPEPDVPGGTKKALCRWSASTRLKSSSTRGALPSEGDTVPGGR